MQIPNPAVYLQIVQLRISNARLKYRLTQEQVADLASMPVRSYQGLEGIRDGRNFNPTLLTLRAVAKALGLELSELIKEPSPEEIQQLEEVLNNRLTRRLSKQS
jgi:transcriptional regulator with XRE-family HTH domain